MYKYAYVYIYVCTDGTVTCLCLCVPMAANSLACFWVNVCVDEVFVCAHIIYVWTFLFPFLHVTTSLHPPPYNTVRHGFCITVKCYLMILHPRLLTVVIDLSLCLHCLCKQQNCYCLYYCYVLIILSYVVTHLCKYVQLMTVLVS